MSAPKSRQALGLAVAFSILGGQMIPSMGFAAEEPYASARECLRTVNEVEQQIKAKDENNTEAQNMLARARDYCIQARYEEAESMLTKVKNMA